MHPTLERILRFPLKGFPGEVLNNAYLHPGSGLPNDRRFAIENGTHLNLTHRDWAPCNYFLRLTVDASLVHYRVSYNDEQQRLTLSIPGNPVVTVSVDCEVDRARFCSQLSSNFQRGNQAPINLVERNVDEGYWDVKDAPISILNLQTIKALSAHADTTLSSERFRSNLEIVGLEPWEELSWIGRTITIGDVNFYITAPIERCAATSIDPDTGVIGASIPQLLYSQFGHLSCGVYARVVKSGRIETGQTVTRPTVLRSMVVSSISTEDSDTTSLTLTSFDDTPLAPFAPGQYVSIEMRDESGSTYQRNYSLSNELISPQTSYRISVKRKGLVSKWLHSLRTGAKLKVSAPKGHFVYHPGPRASVFVAGGIGITPLLAMLKDIAVRDPNRTVWLFYGVRRWLTFTFRQELESLKQVMPHLNIHVHFSRGRPTEESSFCNIHLGRLSIDRIREILPFNAYEFYLCGPSAMMRNVSEGLLKLSVSKDHIHMEHFGQVDFMASKEVFPQQARIRFKKSNREALWQEQAQTLLEFAEQNGISAANDCRAGTCGACRCTVKGRVHYAMTPVFTLKENEALLCCARPLEDMEVEL